MKSKRIFSVLLACVMLLGMVPLSSHAATSAAQQIFYDKVGVWNGGNGTVSYAAANESKWDEMRSAWLAMSPAERESADPLRGMIFMETSFNRWQSQTPRNGEDYVLYYTRGTDAVMNDYATQSMKDARVWAGYISGKDLYQGVNLYTANFSQGANQTTLSAFLGELTAKPAAVLDYIDMFGANGATAYQSKNLTTSFGFACTNRLVTMQQSCWKALDSSLGTPASYNENLADKTFAELRHSADWRNAFDFLAAAKVLMLHFQQNGISDVLRTEYAGVKVLYDRLDALRLRHLKDGSSTTSYFVTTTQSNGTKRVTYAVTLTVFSAFENLMRLYDLYVTIDPVNPDPGDVARAAQLLNALPSSIESYLSNTQFITMKDEILALKPYRGRDPANVDPALPDLSGHTQLPVKYKLPLWGKEIKSCQAKWMPKLVGKLASGRISDALSGLYTNETVNHLVATVGAEVDKANVSTLYTPALAAEYLYETKPDGSLVYADAVAKLQATGGDWTKFTKDADWGFADGDRDGFIKALAAALRPLVTYLGGMGLMMDALQNNELKSAGKYDSILIPVLEALGCPNILSADELNVQRLREDAARKKAGFTKHNTYDCLLIAILNPIFGLADEIAADPINTLTRILPNLAYANLNGALDPFFNYNLANLVSVKGILGVETLDGLIAMIIPKDDDGNPAIVLPAIDWEALSRRGTLVAKETKQGAKQYRAYVQADEVDAYTAITRYVQTLLSQNPGLVRELFANLKLPDFLAAILQWMVYRLTDLLFGLN
jgi:hypothetical protein